MADQNNPQTPQVGVVGQQGQGAPQPAPTQAIPGVPQPPVPSPELIQKIMAEQNAATQKQVQEARARAGYDGPAEPAASQQASGRFAQSGNPAPQPAAQPAAQPAPASAPNQAYQNIPANIASQMPPNMRPQQAAPQPAPQPAAPSPIQGLTAEQVLAGPPRQAPQQQNQPQPPQRYQQPVTQQQPQPQQGGHIAGYAQQQEIVKEKVPWFPVRGKKDSVNIELTDVVLLNVPSKGMVGESNAGAKVTLALFSEILALRERVAWLEQNSGQAQIPQEFVQRVYNLENALFEQKNALSQRARGVKEQIAMGQAQGLSPEQILAGLQGQQVAAQQMVNQGSVPAAQHTTTEQQGAAQANMVAQGTGQAPESQQPAAEPEETSS